MQSYDHAHSVPAQPLRTHQLSIKPLHCFPLMNTLKTSDAFTALACFAASDGFISGEPSGSLTLGEVAYSMFYVFALDRVAC